MEKHTKKPVFKRLWFWLLAALLAASFFLATAHADSPSEILRRNRPLFEQAVQELLYRGGETGVEIPEVTDISVYGVSDGTIVQFTTETKAGLFGPEVQGVYYAVGGGPAAYRNWDYELIYDESDGGWNWYSESGESYGSTRHAAGLDNWFSFSAHIS